MSVPRATVEGHTALRGLAALVIVYGHYAAVFGRDVAGWDFQLPQTYLGVDLFFVLSGFILYHVYGGVFADGLRWRDYWQFMARRLARIYPLHLLTLLAVVVLLRFQVPPGDWGIFWQNVFLVHAWGISDRFEFNAPSWSISAELFAYLSFPVMAVLARRRIGRWSLAVVVVTSLAMSYRYGGGSLDLDAIGRDHVLWRLMIGFPLGVLLGVFVEDGFFGKAIESSALQGVTVFFLIAVFWVGAPDLVIMGPIALLVLVTSGRGGALVAVLRLGLFQWLGAVSYGIYLLQWPIMLFLFSLRPKLAQVMGPLAVEVASLVVFVVVLFGSAHLVFRLIERPIIVAVRRRTDLAAG